MELKPMLNELRKIQKDKENWKDSIDYVSQILDENKSEAVKAKTLWMLGEMGLIYPKKIKKHAGKITEYLEDDNPKLRQRALNAVGRIGRADENLVIPYMESIMKKRFDSDGDVRLAFVWACENIATNAPEMFCEKLEIFHELTDDSYEKVRVEAPEMFRVIGKRKPECVKPYLEKLKHLAESDEHPVVRIHCEGAVRITEKALNSR